MIDFSHANSGKDYRRQAVVCHDVAAQIAGSGNRKGDIYRRHDRKQSGGRRAKTRSRPAAGQLVYGQSITDACIDWKETRALLAELAAAVRARRSAN